jgi:hypothetical protein
MPLDDRVPKVRRGDITCERVIGFMDEVMAEEKKIIRPEGYPRFVEMDPKMQYYHCKLDGAFWMTQAQMDLFRKCRLRWKRILAARDDYLHNKYPDEEPSPVPSGINSGDDDE